MASKGLFEPFAKAAREGLNLNAFIINSDDVGPARPARTGLDAGASARSRRARPQPAGAVKVRRLGSAGRFWNEGDIQADRRVVASHYEFKQRTVRRSDSILQHPPRALNCAGDSSEFARVNTDLLDPGNAARCKSDVVGSSAVQQRLSLRQN